MLIVRSILSAALLLLLAGRACALDRLVVGRSVATALTFAPLEIGERAGIWKRNGLTLEIISFSGDAQLQQALTAGTIEVGLGSGPALAFLAKGVPAKAIGAFGGRPYNVCLVASTRSGARSVQGLKGRTVGVTTLGSLSHWLVLETSRRYGLKDGEALVPVPLGSPRAQLAALIRGQIAGHITTVVEGLTEEQHGTGRIVLNYGDMLQSFITHVFFARNDLVARRPEELRRFLAGWLQTLGYMRDHRDESVQIEATLLGLDPTIVAKAFPYEMATLSANLSFDPRALAVLSGSFVELGLLPAPPDMSRFYTNEFVPLAR